MKYSRSRVPLLSISAVMILVAVSLRLSYAAGGSQQAASYIVVHVHNPEGVEINSIWYGGGPDFAVIYDGESVIATGPEDAYTHHQPIPISPGRHVIRAKFNGMTLEQGITLAEGETRTLIFTFKRTEIDVPSLLSGSGSSFGSHCGNVVEDPGYADWWCLPGHGDVAHWICPKARIEGDPGSYVLSAGYTYTLSRAFFEFAGSFSASCSASCALFEPEFGVPLYLVIKDVPAWFPGGEPFTHWHVQNVVAPYVNPPRMAEDFAMGIALDEWSMSHFWPDQWPPGSPPPSGCTAEVIPATRYEHLQAGPFWFDAFFPGVWRLRVDGANLRISSVPYDMCGTGVSGPQPVVVLVRGLQFVGSQSADDYWLNAASYLRSSGFEVWVCNMITGKEDVKVAAEKLHQFIQAKVVERDYLGLPPPKNISIVAHSYGGLISRLLLHKYCDTHGNLPLEVGGTANIDKVIMLSTSNCGSHLADLGKWIGWLPGLGCEAALKCLTPHFVQDHFNNVCPARPAPVPFYLFGASGGQNRYKFSYGRLYRWPKNTTNPNDGAVTACSAHGWRWLCPCDPTKISVCRDSSGKNCDWVPQRQVEGVCNSTTADNHSTIKANDFGTLDLVRKILLGEPVDCQAPVPGCSCCGAPPPLPPPLLQAGIPQAVVAAEEGQASAVVGMSDGTISQDQTSHASVTLDDCPQAAFALDYASGDVTFTLTTPTGGTIDPTSPDPSVHYSQTADEAGVHESYLIDNPALGAWTVNLTGTSVDPAGAPWSLMVSEESNLGLTSTTEYFQSAGNCIISASVMDGTQPVTGAAVSADARRPDETLDQLTLYDDGAHADGAAGDGLYANVYAQSTPGIYGVKYSATGPNLQGHAFSRIEGDTLQIAPATANLSGAYSDNGEDTGPPPGLENVVVDVGIQVLSEGNYAASAKLADAQGSPLVATSASATGLSAGPATISLKFDADVLRRSGLDGPYKLIDVELWDESGEMPLRADHADSPYTTGPYEPSQFTDQYPPDAVTDLAISGVDSATGAVTLRWTAPSSEGQASASYDIRYSPGGLNSEDWDSSLVLASPPAPAAPAATQTMTVSGLLLGQTYFFGLKSRDQVGNESPLSNVAAVYLGSQLDMRNSPDGTYGAVIGVVAATSGDVGATYVESENRAWGVCVDSTGAAESRKVYVTGFLSRESGEPTMTAASVYDLGAGTPIEPVAMQSKFTGGAGFGFQQGVVDYAVPMWWQHEHSIAINNIGLLVATWGRVTGKGDGYLYVDDGSALRDGTVTGKEQNVGVRAICDPTGYSAGDFLIVTGISSCFETPSGEIARHILTRRSEDIHRVYP